MLVCMESELCCVCSCNVIAAEHVLYAEVVECMNSVGSVWHVCESKKLPLVVQNEKRVQNTFFSLWPSPPLFDYVDIDVTRVINALRPSTTILHTGSYLGLPQSIISHYVVT